MINIWPDFYSDVEVKNSEVLRDTETTISCKITNLAEQLDTVTWEKPGGGAITHNEDGYQIDVGIYESGSKSQTTVLGLFHERKNVHLRTVSRDIYD